MLHFRKITNLFMLSIAMTLIFSCSEDEEVFEQQNAQSQISTEIRQKVTSNAQQSMAVAVFSEQTNWYENLDPAVCGIDFMLLAFEAFDLQGNSLSQISIAPWGSTFGISLEETVNTLEASLEAEFDQDVDVIFLSGLLIKQIDEDTAEIAQVNSYTLFNEYFDDCQSDEVVFELNDGTPQDWVILDPPAPQDDVDFPQIPCLSIQFPLDIIVAEENNASSTLQVSVTETEFMEYLSGNVTNYIVVDFVYPISLLSEDGSIFTANTITEVEQLFEQECN